MIWRNFQAKPPFAGAQSSWAVKGKREYPSIMECPSGAFISVISPGRQTSGLCSTEYWLGNGQRPDGLDDYASIGVARSFRIGNFDYVLTVQRRILLLLKKGLIRRMRSLGVLELGALGWYSSDKTPMIASPL